MAQPLYMVQSRSYLFLLFSWEFVLPSIQAMSVTIKPGQMECYIVSASSGTVGYFEILSPDPLPISITVNDPPPTHKLYHESKYRGIGAIRADETEGSFAFDADLKGIIVFVSVLEPPIIMMDRRS